MYEVIVDPLSFAPDHVMIAELSPPTADTAVGAVGRLNGITLLDTVDGFDTPTPLIAVT